MDHYISGRTLDYFYCEVGRGDRPIVRFQVKKLNISVEIYVDCEVRFFNWKDGRTGILRTTHSG